MLSHLKDCGRGGNTETSRSNALEEWEGFGEEYVDYDNFEYSSEEEEPWKLDLNVCTYNVHHGRDGAGRWSLDRMMRLLADLSPDLLCLQEVAPDLMRVLVTQLDYPHVLHHRDQHGFTALLSRLPFTTLWWPFHTGDQVRYVTAGVELGGGERVAVTRIHLSPKWESRRLMELQRLESELAELRDQP